MSAPKTYFHLENENLVARDAQPPPGAPRTPREPLDAYGEALLKRIDGNVSLRATAARFPHIVNRLARAWVNAQTFQKEMSAVLLDDRTQREGLPFEVLTELTALSEYHRSKVAVLVPSRRRGG